MLFFFAILGIATATLVCEDFIPKDALWNASSATSYWSSDDTFPARHNLQAGNPWKFGKASVYNIRNCTDDDLGIQHTVTAQCEDDYEGAMPNIGYTDWVQIINPWTGHCLTAQPNNTLIFKTCHTSPTNLTQFFRTDRTISYTDGCENSPTYQPSEIMTHYLVKGDSYRAREWRPLADKRTMAVQVRDPKADGHFTYLYLVPTKTL